MRKAQANLSAHLRDDELLLFAERELSPRRAGKARDHLAQCPVCRARIGQLEAAMGEFASFHETAVSATSRSHRALRSALKERLREASAGYPRPAFAFGRTVSPAARQMACACVALLLVAGGGWALRSLARHSPDAHATDELALALPSKRLTPGATRAVSVADLCENYAAAAPLPIDASLAQQVFNEYGLPASSRNAYELDYLITPELGGSTDIRNLWPEPYYSTSWNAHVKDALEEHLHELVCEGKLPLATAQDEIATDWIAAYKKQFHTDSPLSNAAALDSNGEIAPSRRGWDVSAGEDPLL